MNITITAESRHIITLAEAPVIAKMYEALVSDTWSARDYAEMAARIASGCNTVNVLQAQAEIAKNERACNSIYDGSADFDIWITFTATINNTFGGIIIGGAYLTDLWQHNSADLEATRSHMYIRKFAEIA